MMMMSHTFTDDRSNPPFFIGYIYFFFFFFFFLLVIARETESGDLRESSVCLFLSRRVFLRARVPAVFLLG